MIAALIVLVLAAGWRVFTLQAPDLSNFSPIMALAFCSGVYFQRRWLWIIPVAALLLSDLYINYYYATTYRYEWTLRDNLIRIACFGVGLGLGLVVAKRRSWMGLLGGLLGSSVVFYLATNTAAWKVDPAYAGTWAGWVQAMTVGHPQYPSTLSFYRNTLASDLFFTGVFALAMEYRALKAGSGSLLGKRAGA